MSESARDSPTSVSESAGDSPTSHSLATRLASENPEERLAACREALDHPEGALFLERICDALGDSDPQVARAASRTLVAAGRRGDGIPPLVRAVLRHPQGTTPASGRLQAALTLSQLATPSPELLPALVDGLDHSAASLRWDAARTLVDVGRLHPETVTLLMGLVRYNESALTQRMAMHCLRELAPDLPEAAEALVAASRDTAAPRARAALLAMAGLYGPPDGVITRLREAAGGDDPASRAIAERALRQYGIPASHPDGGAKPTLEKAGSGTQ